MRDYRIGCDAHKRYSQVEVQDDRGRVVRQARVYHEAGAVHRFFAQFPQGTPVALESVGNWYWIADEIEAAGCIPLLTHPAKAKVMMGHVNKTDKLDANGLATLLRIGSLPTVWLPPAEVRDERELPRTRMALCNMRTALKNRIHSTLAKYALSPEDGVELFSKKGQAWLEQAIPRLPPETGRCLQQEVELLGSFNEQIQTLEARIREEIALTSSMRLLKTLPGVGDILAIVIDREVGTISRFPGSQNFSSYSGTTPRVSSSGGKTHLGHMRTESNQYLKWAFRAASRSEAEGHRSRQCRRRSPRSARLDSEACFQDLPAHSQQEGALDRSRCRRPPSRGVRFLDPDQERALQGSGSRPTQAEVSTSPTCANSGTRVDCDTPAEGDHAA